MATYICSDIIGFTMHEADSFMDAWVEAHTTPVPLDCYYAKDKNELWEKLQADGFKTVVSNTRWENIYEVQK